MKDRRAASLKDTRADGREKPPREEPVWAGLADYLSSCVRNGGGRKQSKALSRAHTRVHTRQADMRTDERRR